MNEPSHLPTDLESIRERDVNSVQPGNQFDENTWLGHVGAGAVRDRRWLLDEIERLTKIEAAARLYHAGWSDPRSCLDGWLALCASLHGSPYEREWSEKTMLDAPAQYDSTQASIWAVGYNKGYRDASNELRSEGAATGAEAAGSAGETGAQSPEESRDGQAQGGHTPQEQSPVETQARDGESRTPPFSGSGTSFLGGKER